jgi:hypothetical protein
MKFCTLLSFIFVSDRKRKEGRKFLTSQRSSPTVESDPKPRQFQHRKIIACGGAAHQPPPDPPIEMLKQLNYSFAFSVISHSVDPLQNFHHNLLSPPEENLLLAHSQSKEETD